MDEEAKRDIIQVNGNIDAQQRQDEAMKLINEDNPFENPI